MLKKLFDNHPFVFLFNASLLLSLIVVGFYVSLVNFRSEVAIAYLSVCGIGMACILIMLVLGRVPSFRRENHDY